MKTACKRKIWFWSYRPKCSPPIRLQDVLNFNISKTIWGINHVIFAGFGQVFPGIPNAIQNNKMPIFLGRVELFCSFVVCSYSSMGAIVLSCCFSWVWSSMPKVLWNNKLPISLERVKWVCCFFACSYLHLVRYPLKLQKYAILCWDYQP